jgi:hypothetical protein
MATHDKRPVPALTPPMMRLAAHLLDLAASRFSNHTCTDLDLSKIPGFETHEARVEIDRAHHVFNGDPEEHDPARVTEYTDNWVMMYLCAAALRAAAEEPSR